MTSTTTPPEQLTLLPDAPVPVQFRLDEATRRRGLRHVAEIRAQLDRQARSADTRRFGRSRESPQRGRPAA